MISSTLIVGEGVGLDMRLNDYFSLFGDLPKIFVTDCRASPGLPSEILCDATLPFHHRDWSIFMGIRDREISDGRW